MFTPFSKVWRRVGWDAPNELPADDFRWCGAGADGLETNPLGERPDAGFELTEVGEEAAHARWTRFLHAGVDDYHDRRDLPAIAGTSQLSPALKWGTSHPRQLLADPDGEYVARWVPEPAAPMLEHKVEREEALRRLASIR